MELDKAIEHALDGNAILFLGAGFSIGGINIDNEPIRTGTGLAHILMDNAKIPYKENDNNLTIAASRYVDDETYGKGKNALISFLKRKIQCTEIHSDDVQLTICNLPWKRIYTTNFDNMIELASSKIGRQRKTITATSQTYVEGENIREAIIHINGYIENLTEKKFDEEFKITDDNYLKSGLLNDSTWGNLFQTDLESASAIIFVGYSLNYDQDIKQLLLSLGIKAKCVFIDIPEMDSSSEYTVKKYGNLYKIGINKFANEIVEVQKKHTPNPKAIDFFGFEKIKRDQYFTYTKYSPLDIYAFMIKGEFQRKFLNQKGYCVRRGKSTTNAKKLLSEKNILIIQSKLGNGKTVYLENLMYSLCDDNDVYFVKDLSQMTEDLEIVFENSTKPIILCIDDYGYYLDLIKWFKNGFPDKLKIILTSRSSININLYYDLINKFSFDSEKIGIITIDKLDDSELYELIDMLTINRLWGEHDPKNYSQKKKILVKQYNSNMSSIFYLLLKSETIQKEIEKTMNIVFGEREIKNIVILQAINSICKFKFTFPDLCKFANFSASQLERLSMNSDYSEAFSYRDNKLCFSSAIFSRYIINEERFSEDIIDKLKTMYLGSCSPRYERKYSTQRKMLISRSNIMLTFEKKGGPTRIQEEKILFYYDQLKNTYTASKNPFFWFQFGITALNMKKYSLANLYFDTAYANIGEMSQFDTFQLDTHKARLILHQQMDTNRNSGNDAWDSFLEAHELLMHNSNEGKNLSYVIKQISTYYDYFEKYNILFSEDQRKEYIDKSFEASKKFRAYFSTVEKNSISRNDSLPYLEFRKIFIGTKYVTDIWDIDKLYNEKAIKKIKYLQIQ